MIAQPLGYSNMLYIISHDRIILLLRFLLYLPRLYVSACPWPTQGFRIPTMHRIDHVPAPPLSALRVVFSEKSISAA